MIYLFHFINLLCVFVLSIIKCIDVAIIAKYQNNFFLDLLLSSLYEFKFEITVFCALFILLYALVVVLIRPRKGKRKLTKDILTRINAEIFDKDLDAHRVTLFKEIRYPKAIVKYIIAFCYHLFCYRKKVKLYFRFPRMGHYLGVYERCGLQLNRSSTMLRVEENDANLCEGIAGYIRYKKMSIQIDNLSDLSPISEDEWLNAKKIGDVRKKYRKAVVSYMTQGYLRDLNIFKKLHRKARHFYGTVISNKKGEIWGVLLVDSISSNTPFNDTVREKVDSFARTISGIIDMEV